MPMQMAFKAATPTTTPMMMRMVRISASKSSNGRQADSGDPVR
jgi:hypothetical protein